MVSLVGAIMSGDAAAMYQKIPRPLLVGLTGFKGSGKSLVATKLQAQGFLAIPFAAPLKAMLLTLGLTPAQVYGNQKEEPSALLLGKTPRYAMQTLGTEWGRKLIDPLLWITLWAIQVNQSLANGYSVVTDDLRFINEAECIRKLDGEVWRIVRPGHVGSNHESETELSSITQDYTIHNKAVMADLYIQVDNILRR